jgi:hypothetical protein
MDVDDDAPSHTPGNLGPTTHTSLTNPVNKALESGDWTQSIMWGPKVPFRDFTQLEFNHEDDVVPEERPPGAQACFWHCIFSLIYRICRMAPPQETLSH